MRLWAFHWSIWGWPNVHVFFDGFDAPRRMSARGYGANVNNQNPIPLKKKQKKTEKCTLWKKTQRSVHCEKKDSVTH